MEPPVQLRARRPTLRPALRQRSLSSSAAEDVVTQELRARRRQPDRPVHSPADSLLSWARPDPVSTAGLVNWGGLLLALCGARLALENLLTYGLRVSAAGWVSFLLGSPAAPHHYPALCLLAGLPLPPLLALGLERLLAGGLLGAQAGRALHWANLAGLLCLPPVLISRLSLGLVSAVLACGLYCITCLKLISFIQVNSWCRQPGLRLTRKMTFASSAQLPPDQKTDDSLVVYPANLTVRDMAYFCLAPTLCYELNFPRTARVRKLFLLRRLAEVVIGTNLILALTQQWIVPVVVNSLVPFSGSDLPLATERLIRLALPNHVIWLMGGFILFHSGLNIAGELLQFADRDFYHDWWNSPNVSKFWQTWNLPVHRWFVRHLFKPLLASGWSRGTAIMSVFLVSSFFHEYLVSVPLRMFKPWLFLGFMCNVPLVLLSGWLEETLGPRAGNLSMWLCLVLGQPLLVMAYYHDYVVEHHGHSLIHHYGRLSSAPL